MKMSTQNLRLFREDFTNEMKKTGREVPYYDQTGRHSIF